MLTIPGPSALSADRVKKLQTSINRIAPTVSLNARYMHFIDTPKLNSRNQKILSSILDYGEPAAETTDGQLFLVVPRIGTISPWSTKATDILHSCGLDRIRRIEYGVAYYIKTHAKLVRNIRSQIAQQLHDRMTQNVLTKLPTANELFNTSSPRRAKSINVLSKGIREIAEANRIYGMALSENEIKYLADSFIKIGRNPTDVELMMFAQANSEHSRHKIFNASWTIDGQLQSQSLFQMIKNTYKKNPAGILSAYSDNAAVMEGGESQRSMYHPKTKVFQYQREAIHILMKVETHNHPSAIAPFPGAATGAGGEIRDATATGRSAKPKAGLIGFTLSNLRIPSYGMPWEKPPGQPERISSPLQIITEGPLGSASYNNEFGRPALLGYFRTFEQTVAGKTRGYHKPIVIAGGIGNIRANHVKKLPIPARAKLLVLGGPAMLIGLGGSAGSSKAIGSGDSELDFASVQRGNAEIQRRAQEVLDQCWSLGSTNPILSIHDVGAGGLSNAFPELVENAHRGAKFELRNVPNADLGMSPMEIWSNEAQERYVLAIKPSKLSMFEKICLRERCPFAVVGEATNRQQLVINDRHFSSKPVDIPMNLLFGNPPKLKREFEPENSEKPKLRLPTSLAQAAQRVLRLPSVASKKFLITIGDRTVGGMVSRDQMVGPWQEPVADVAVTTASYEGFRGEAMAMGERTPLALIDAPAAARISVGEALTNIAAANIGNLKKVKLSANWMAAAGQPGEDQKLYEAVRAVGIEFCPALGISIPVGKDSMSMSTLWQENGEKRSVTSPLSLIITAFAPVRDVRNTLTPQLREISSNTRLLLVDLGNGRNRMGGSALAQVYNQIGNESPDINPKELKVFFNAIQSLTHAGKILAYHDRSDGGLFTTLCEMAFASRLGLDINLDSVIRNRSQALSALFNEELGAVLQVRASDTKQIVLDLTNKGLAVHDIGQPSNVADINFAFRGRKILKNSRIQYQQWWAETSYRIQALRDNPKTAKQEYSLILDSNDPGLNPHITFKLGRRKYNQQRPKIAILREQGVNGQMEMAAAFDKAGFTAMDVHMTDIISGKINLNKFTGLAACGGFSYGDVLGAGGGWAKSILFNSRARGQFEEFFHRKNTFSLGVCNGCQMLSQIKELIPGTEQWPRFIRNLSDRFEARVALVQINKTPSVLLTGMEGSVLPIPTAHGEGRAVFSSEKQQRVTKNNLITMQYVDNYRKTTEVYPANPNGSPSGITGLTSEDGRATIIMPHPERVFRTIQNSWYPEEWGEDGPWLKIFQNARAWVG